MAEARTHLAGELLRRLAASLRAAQLYSAAHPIIGRNIESLGRAMEALHLAVPAIVVGLVGDEVIVNEVPMAKVEGLATLVRRLTQVGIERITIDRGVTAEEVAALAEAVAACSEASQFPALPHIRVGRVSVAEHVRGGDTDMPTFQQLYADAVHAAQGLWDTARADARPDATLARRTVDGLAQAVSQNRTALLALTALREYDDYTFTHMVNVSILTMAQARVLGVDGAMLREFGLAALLHDIGKVQTPLDVLNKEGGLTSEEFAIMQRHVVDGAEMLRATPDIPALAPVVAFEHHLRLDGSGYPAGVTRTSLNLSTMLCSIADVYDAMRSQRVYQQSFPSERILAVLQRNDGTQFDQHLVRRFSQLVGIYPVGNLVRLSTGEIAVVVRTHAPDPHRPRIRVIIDRHGARVPLPIDVNLWETAAEGALAPTIVAPVDPREVGVEPLALL